MRIAVVQHDIVWCEREVNFDRLSERIAEAAANDADVVVLSETFSTGFAVTDERFAEPENGPSSQFLRTMAVDHGLWVGGSCPEVPAQDAVGDGVVDGRPANTFVLAGADGTVHRYRKIHPFTFGGEDRHVRPGDELVTVNIDGLRVSMFVCYDLRFSNEFWNVAHETDMYLIPANWPAARREHWMTLLRARAIENQAYVVGCNRVGEGGGLVYSGDSCVIGPFGEELAVAGDGETILYADVSAANVVEVRDRFRFLQDRRPD
jgi:predicted amidohydrolase